MRRATRTCNAQPCASSRQAHGSKVGTWTRGVVSGGWFFWPPRFREDATPDLPSLDLLTRRESRAQRKESTAPCTPSSRRAPHRERRAAHRSFR